VKSWHPAAIDMLARDPAEGQQFTSRAGASRRHSIHSYHPNPERSFFATAFILQHVTRFVSGYMYIFLRLLKALIAMLFQC